MKKALSLLTVLSLILSYINVSVYAEKLNYTIQELHQILLDYSKNISPIKNNEPASFAINSDETEPLPNWIDFADEPPKYEDFNFFIYTAEHLAWVAKEVNEGNEFLDTIITLKANIDLSGKEWTPIGAIAMYDSESARGFCGTFNGDGYKISNLTITKMNRLFDGLSFLGLFGFVNDAEIANVAVVDCNIAVFDERCGYIGIAAPLIGSESDSLVYNCYASGTVVSERGACGLIGFSEGYVANCYSEVNLYGYPDSIAGIVGMSWTGFVTRCYWSGEATFFNEHDSSIDKRIFNDDEDYYDDEEDDDEYYENKQLLVFPLLISYNTWVPLPEPIDVNVFYTRLSYLYWDVDKHPVYDGYDFNKRDKYTTPLTTAQLKSELPPGFSDNVWGIIPGLTYPYLKVFGEPEFKLSVEQADVNSVKVKVGDYASGCKLFAALYSPDGVLLETKILPAESGTINFSQPIADNKYKIFLWSDTDKIIPAAIAE